MLDLKARVPNLLYNLYSDEVIDQLTTAAAHYAKQKAENPVYVDVPSSLHGATRARQMSDVVVGAPSRFKSEILSHLGVLKSDGTLKGPLNHMLARMFTIPRMLQGYIGNWPTDDEKAIYTDPPLLQMDRDQVGRIYDDYFARAADMLGCQNMLAMKFKLLGEIGEDVCEVESVYPATNSTEAYELFGIWHLFKSNEEVDLTSTSPGVILPTEADPLRYKDSVTILKKNLLRPTYFEMLRLAVNNILGEGRNRRYFASREGTKKNLLAYPELIGVSKEILSQYLDMGKGVFEIRIGDPLPEMKLATLVGDKGVVYSIRDKEQKGKIAHNLTVIDINEARGWRDVFNRQWATGEPMTVDMIDKLVA
jgi:hypothetical protein